MSCFTSVEVTDETRKHYVLVEAGRVTFRRAVPVKRIKNLSFVRLELFIRFKDDVEKTRMS